MASKWKEDVVIERDFEGFGLHFEADEVVRSLRGGFLSSYREVVADMSDAMGYLAGELENKRMPHDETEMVMEVSSIRQDSLLLFSSLLY